MLPQVYLLPWVALLIVGHTGLQLGFYAKSDIITSGWLSAFLPNNFRSESLNIKNQVSTCRFTASNIIFSDAPPSAERVATS